MCGLSNKTQRRLNSNHFKPDSPSARVAPAALRFPAARSACLSSNQVCTTQATAWKLLRHGRRLPRHHAPSPALPCAAASRHPFPSEWGIYGAYMLLPVPAPEPIQNVTSLPYQSGIGHATREPMVQFRPKTSTSLAHASIEQSRHAAKRQHNAYMPQGDAVHVGCIWATSPDAPAHNNDVKTVTSTKISWCMANSLT
jgi:hypothetical protein